MIEIMTVYVFLSGILTPSNAQDGMNAYAFSSRNAMRIFLAFISIICESMIFHSAE
jgi:hypothetical protein